MRLYTYRCDCGASLAAIVEKDERASGGKSVRFSDRPGTLTAYECMVSETCSSCNRTIPTEGLREEDGWRPWPLLDEADRIQGAITIEDPEEIRRTIRIEVIDGEDGILWLRPEGYGDKVAKDGEGLPIGVGLRDGKLEVYLWDDINDEDHKTYSMEGAREDARNPDHP